MTRALPGRFTRAEVLQGVDVFARQALRALRNAFDALSSRVTTAEATIAALPATYVDVAGDTMTGNLDVPGVSSVRAATFNDDSAQYIEFSGLQRGAFVIAPNTQTGGIALVFFRCGDGSANITIVSSAGATVTGGVGTLAGTTGTDGHLTIRANTANNRVYFENRTGAVRGYSVTFLSLHLAASVAGAFVAV